MVDRVDPADIAEMRRKMKREAAERAAKGKRLGGLAIPFGVQSEDLGGFKEVISRHAFRDSLRDHPDVFCLHSHDSSRPLARTTAGNLELSERASGIYAVASDLRTSDQMDALLDVRRGIISSFSFGFIVERDEWNDVNGELIRTVLAARLLEISLVIQPAYLQTFAHVTNERSVDRLADNGHKLQSRLRVLMLREQQLLN